MEGSARDALAVIDLLTAHFSTRRAHLPEVFEADGPIVIDAAGAHKRDR